MVKSTKFAGWNDKPCYYCKTYDEYTELVTWMNQNRVGYFLLSSGSNGYTFQVQCNHEWFVLRWISNENTTN